MGFSCKVFSIHCFKDYSLSCGAKRVFLFFDDIFSFFPIKSEIYFFRSLSRIFFHSSFCVLPSAYLMNHGLCIKLSVLHTFVKFITCCIKTIRCLGKKRLPLLVRPQNGLLQSLYQFGFVDYLHSENTLIVIF